jgi:hypothetical protein
VKNKIPIFLKIVCVLSIIGSSFLTALNYSMYTSPGDIAELRENMLKETEKSVRLMTAGNNQEKIEKRLANLKKDVEQNITTAKFKLHSMYRIIGNFLTLLGAMFMLKTKKLGFHLYLAGTLFSVITGFYAFGLGTIGWSFNITYIFAGLIFIPIYLKSLKHLG